MLKRVLPMLLMIALLFSSVAFAAGQGSGKVSPSKAEAKSEMKLGAGFAGEKEPVTPCEREEWTTFTYALGCGYGYGYANNYYFADCDCCTDGSVIATPACCDFYYQHHWNWPCLPDQPDEDQPDDGCTVPDGTVEP